MKKITALILLFMISPSYAAMYKWTDDQGNTHYGERPPNRQQAESIAPPPPPASSSGDNSEHLKSLREGILQQTIDDKGAKEKAAKKSKERKQRNVYCEKLRGRIASFKSHPRIRQKDENGNYAFLDDPAKQKQEKEMQQRLAKDCS